MQKKIIVITVARNFFKGHVRAGEPTEFKSQILEGKKIHTMRAGQYWKNVVDKVNAGTHILSVREWTGKPYASPQKEICQFDKVGWQEVTITHFKNSLTGSMMLYPSVLIKNDAMLSEIAGGRYLDRSQIDTLAANDGLSPSDFISWFKKDFTGGILYFTDFRY